MRRILIVGSLLLATVLSPSPAAAADLDAAAREAIALELEALIGRIEGVDFTALPVRDHGRQLFSVAIPLPAATRERLLGSVFWKAPDFQPLAVGLQLSAPTDFSTLITAVLAQADTVYNFWFVVVNLRDEAEAKKTVFQTKGPGEDFKIVDQFVYDPSAVIIFFTEQNSGDTGVHSLQVKVTGGGKAKTKYFAN